MNRIAKALALGLLPLLATCCPTVWLQVSKTDPAPWIPVELQGTILDGPLLVPAMPNRFDVLEKGIPTIGAAEFADVPDPQSNVSAYARAIDALTWIEQHYPKPNADAQPGPPEHADQLEVDATLQCTHPDAIGMAANCHILKTEKKTGAASVWLKGRQVAVLSEGCDTEGCFANLSAAIPGLQGEKVEVYVRLPPLSTPLLSFVHLSDIQLRDPSITLTNRQLSHKLDRFEALASFEYDQDLEFYNHYLVEAVIETINKLKPSPEDVPPEYLPGGGSEGARTDPWPRFVIHTGDSIDSGAMSELLRFHALIDRLQRVPFYQVFGNHDVLAFGNLTPTSTHNGDGACTPVSDLIADPGMLGRWVTWNTKLCVDWLVKCDDCLGTEGALVACPSQDLTRQNFMKHFEHVRADRVVTLHDPAFPPEGKAKANDEAYCPDPKGKVWSRGYSRVHGFDLGTSDGTLNGRKLGYYAFATPLYGENPRRNAVVIALNTDELEDGHGGVPGRIEPDQWDWLERVLSCVKTNHPKDLMLVFAHHPLSKIVAKDAKGTQRNVADLLNRHAPNVAGYFYGHSHEHSICGDSRSDKCANYWEVETASLIEFPQEGRLVRIKKVNDKLAYFELTALHERLASPDTDLAHNVRLARRGAERDYCYTHRGEEKLRCTADQRPYRLDGRDANARLFFALP
jgi:3',5'-cyclic AMP phosphodiesterase CpdA